VVLTNVRCQVYLTKWITRVHRLPVWPTASPRALSDQAVSTAATTSDAWGQGAFFTEEASAIFDAARQLLIDAVVADRERGCSWTDVGESLGITRQSAQERFVADERVFCEAVLFPLRASPNGGLARSVAPYAVEAPDRVGRRLDEWVRERRRARIKTSQLR
jgi:hypothetical protein